MSRILNLIDSHSQSTMYSISARFPTPRHTIWTWLVGSTVGPREEKANLAAGQKIGTLCLPNEQLQTQRQELEDVDFILVHSSP